MMMSISTEKPFDKIQHLSMIKIPNKLIIEGDLLNLIKGICEKPIANFILNGETECFSPKNGSNIGMFILTTLFNIILEVWAVK